MYKHFLVRPVIVKASLKAQYCFALPILVIAYYDLYLYIIVCLFVYHCLLGGFSNYYLTKTISSFMLE